MTRPLTDNLAAADALRCFADLIAADARAAVVRRIEVTLHGRGPIERLFALEAALAALWPGGGCVLTFSPARASPPTLSLRALDHTGAEVVRAAYPVSEGRAKRAAAVDG